MSRALVRVFLVLVSLALSVAASPALGASGLPRTYQVQRIDSSAPTVGGRFGLSLVAVGDINGDGKTDILTGTDKHGTALGQGQVSVLSGSDGRVLRNYALLDIDTDTNRPSGFGNSITPLADIGKCNLAPPGGAGNPCPVGQFSTAGDGIPEEVVGASGVDLNVATGQPDPTTNNNLGVIYVFDGATGALLKRLVMPSADRTEQTTAPTAGDPRFGRTLLSPGDVTGDGKPDILVGATDYNETKATAHPQSQCALQIGTANCLGAGRVYLYSGAAIDGDPSTPLQTATTIKSPLSQPDDNGAIPPGAFAASEQFGIQLIPIGAAATCTSGAPVAPGGACTTPTNAAGTAANDFAIAGSAYDVFGMDGVGRVIEIDGTTLANVKSTDYPDPAPEASWGQAQNGRMFPALGDVAGRTNPDFYVSDIQWSGDHAAQGRGLTVSGAPSDSTSYSEFPSRFVDPTPQTGEQFGLAAAGIGDVAGAETDPALDARGEIMIGAIGPHNPGTNQQVVNDVHIFSPLTEKELQRIPAPDAQGGEAFGVSLAPLGDVNGDGFQDYAVGAGFFDVKTSGGPCPSSCLNAGRVYILRSDNSPAPVPPTPSGPGVGPQGPAGPTTVVTLAGRDLELVAKSGRVRRGRSATLRGAVEAFSNQATCETGQTVLLQRRPPSAVRYTTIARLKTDRNGNFARTFKPTSSGVYRARVSQSSQCLGATSNRASITVRGRSRPARKRGR
ncbi:MAG: integrin alpha [Actinomycetota bacterium]|nr:integrin alpha [Actinomycetota bacterium]